MNNFTTIAPKYQQTAVLQKSASEQLFDMLSISRTDDVLDLGCGTGHLTRKIRSFTKGVVVGIDPSEGMVTVAQRNNQDGIAFHVQPAENLDMVDQFDVIFCNSAFQWFRNPSLAISNCYSALSPGGRMAMQAPARNDYCPNFVLAVCSLREHPDTQETFAHFHSPWFFLETAEEYADIFAKAGFSVVSSAIETVRQRSTPTRAFEMFEMFESGAAAGYLNPDCYNVMLPSKYISIARGLIERQFESQAAHDGDVELTFHRIYLLGRRP